MQIEFHIQHTGAKHHFWFKNTLEYEFEKCEFCEKWDFPIVSFVKNKIFKMWILLSLAY